MNFRKTLPRTSWKPRRARRREGLARGASDDDVNVVGLREASGFPDVLR